MRPGNVIQIRSVYRGRVRWRFPHRLIADDGERVVAFLEPGARGVQMGRDADGRYLERWVRGDDPCEHTWTSRHVLKLIRRGEAHSLEVLWDEDWTFEGWYVNLQAPLVETQDGFDTTDWALDIVVDPSGTWHWKDEDDFAEAQALGVFSTEEAAAVRAEGERVIAARPWPTGWEDWRP
jgi:uncharacterized protein DUF402